MRGDPIQLFRGGLIRQRIKMLNSEFERSARMFFMDDWLSFFFFFANIVLCSNFKTTNLEKLLRICNIRIRKVRRLKVQNAFPLRISLFLQVNFAINLYARGNFGLRQCIHVFFFISITLISIPRLSFDQKLSIW